VNKKGIYILMLFLALIAATSQVSAQISNNIQHLNRYSHNWGDGVRDLVMRGYYCYMASGSDGLRISGNLDRLEPEIGDLGRYPCDYAEAVAVSGNYAYVGSANDGFLVIDVSNPRLPTLVDQIQFSPGETFNAIRIFGNYAFTCCSPSGLTIIDISDPSNTQPVCNLSNTFDCRDIDIHGNLAYVAAASYGLQEWDISSLSYPQLLRTYTCGDGQWVTGGTVSGNYAYLACGWDGFRVIDLTSFQMVADIDSLAYGFRVIFNGNYAYMTYGDPECPLAIIDITNPLSPQTMGVYYPPEDIVNFQVVGGQIFAADFKHGVLQLDISDPTNPYRESSYNNYGRDLDVSLRWNYAIIRDEHAIKIFDISNIDNPNQASLAELNRVYNDLLMAGGVGFMVEDGDTVLRAIDLEEPSLPTRMGTFVEHDCGVHNSAAVYGNYVYLVQPNGLRIIDVTNLFSLQQVGFFSRELINGKAIVYGQTLFIQDRDYDLIVLDLTDPLNPNLIAEWPIAQYCQNLKAAAGKLYVITNQKLWIFNIATFGAEPPLSQTTLINYPGAYLHDLDINGNYLYVVGDTIGLCVYDVSNPATPICTGYSNISERAMGVAVRGNIAIVANVFNIDFYDCSAALDVDQSDISLPKAFALLPNYPNPFNGATQLQFELSQPGRVRLEVFDILGRNINTLADADFEAGRHSIIWNGENSAGQSVSSGRYFIQAKSGENIQSIPVMLLK
jgi:hypothetical protein